MLGVAFLVALASLRNFPVYLMDELDAALDPENQKVRHARTQATNAPCSSDSAPYSFVLAWCLLLHLGPRNAQLLQPSLHALLSCASSCLRQTRHTGSSIQRCATLIRNVSQNAQVVVVSHNVSFQNQADTRVNI